MAPTSGQIEKMRRDAANRIVVSNPLECYHCKNSVAADDQACRVCAFPQKGTQEEMRRFVWNKRKEKKQLKEDQAAYLKRINRARWISLALGAIFFIGFLMESDVFKLFDPFLYAVYIFFIVTFLLSGYFMLKYPRICAPISLGLYIIWIAIQATGNPGALSQGILIKILFIAGLVYGVKEAFTNKPPVSHIPDLEILDDAFLSD